MARIRTIKPEFWSDEKLGPLAPLDRLVFLGLVSQADDGGRVVDSVRLIDGLLFSQTHDTCADSLVKLTDLGVIERGTTESGQQIIEIVGWSKHQKVDKPSNRGALPPIKRPNGRRRSSRPTAISSAEPLAEVSGETRESVARDSRYEVDLGSGPWTLDQDQEREQDLGARASSASPDDGTPNFDGYVPTDDQRTRSAELHVDLDSALRKWRGTRKANGATPVDLVADFDAWLEREPQYASSSNGNGARSDDRPALPIARTSGFRPVDRDGREVDLTTGLPIGEPTRPRLAVDGVKPKRGALGDAAAKILGLPVPAKLDGDAAQRFEESRARMQAQGAVVVGKPTGGAPA